MKQTEKNIEETQDIEESQDLEREINSDDDAIARLSGAKPSETYTSIAADDSIKIYLQQIGKIPLLSFEEDLEVARQIKEKHSQRARVSFSI